MPWRVYDDNGRCHGATTLATFALLMVRYLPDWEIRFGPHLVVWTEGREGMEADDPKARELMYARQAAAEGGAVPRVPKRAGKRQAATNGAHA